MNRQVRSLGKQATLRVEQCARVILPLLDVGTVGRALERLAHLLGNTHKRVVQDGDVCSGLDAHDFAPRPRFKSSWPDSVTFNVQPFFR